jgi:septal ring factor EnvC (AmiA/AmiB activator)
MIDVNGLLAIGAILTAVLVAGTFFIARLKDAERRGREKQIMDDMLKRLEKLETAMEDSKDAKAKTEVTNSRVDDRLSNIESQMEKITAMLEDIQRHGCYRNGDHGGENGSR